MEISKLIDAEKIAESFLLLGKPLMLYLFLAKLLVNPIASVACDGVKISKPFFSLIASP